MKSMKLFTLVLFIVSSLMTVQAQTSDSAEVMDKNVVAQESYIICLQHENDGVVESAIGNVLLFKKLNPEVDTQAIEKELENISVNGETESVRRKALLANHIIKNPALVSKIDKKFYNDIELFFEVLAIGSGLQDVDLTSMSKVDVSAEKLNK